MDRWRKTCGGRSGGERDGGRRDGDGAADNGDRRHVGSLFGPLESCVSPLLAPLKGRGVEGVIEMEAWIGIRCRVSNGRDQAVTGAPKSPGLLLATWGAPVTALAERNNILRMASLRRHISIEKQACKTWCRETLSAVAWAVMRLTWPLKKGGPP